MLTRVASAVVLGIEARLVDVQVDVAHGLPGTRTLGLPDSAIRESAERVRSAIVNSGFEFPPRRITINLAPADLPKSGAGFDLPLALGLLEAFRVEGAAGPAGAPLPGDVARTPLNRWLWAGELSLDGQVHPVRGILPIALAARREGWEGVVTAPGVAAEAALVGGIEARAVRTLAEAWAFAQGRIDLPRLVASDPAQAGQERAAGPDEVPDLSEVRGQPLGRRAVEIAAAGGHNLLFIGPPGAGKTMLARRLPGLLPPLSPDDSLEVTCLYSVAGLLPPAPGLIRVPPLRAPHHSASEASMAGGGVWLRPGEISLAHAGVLFLDELPEFPRRALEALRQPLEEGRVRIARARATVDYPARFLLVAALNPCPCGHLGDERRSCVCSAASVARYRARVSGPLLDRMDLHVWLPALSAADLDATGEGESSASVRARVLFARSLQAGRNGGSPTGAVLNSALGPRRLRAVAPLDKPGAALLSAAIERLGLSARAYHRVLRVARTVADLAGEERVAQVHIAEAVQFRQLDRSRVDSPGARS